MHLMIKNEDKACISINFLHIDLQNSKMLNLYHQFSLKTSIDKEPKELSCHLEHYSLTKL